MLHGTRLGFGTGLKDLEFEKMCQNHIYKVLKWQKLHTKKVPFFKISKPKLSTKPKDLHNIVAIIVLKNEAHIQRNFPPFLLSHLVVSWYFYHQRWLSNFNEHCHNWFNSPKYDTTCIVHNNACKRQLSLKRKIQLYWEHISKDYFIRLTMEGYDCLHFHFNSFLNYLCSYHYSMLLTIKFNSHNAYFLLLITCVHSLPMCISHCDFSSVLSCIESIRHLYHTSQSMHLHR